MDSKKRRLFKEQFINQAKYIFEKNTFKGYSSVLHARYKFIAPADVEYTYQWLWDTAFHAIVLSNFDPKWAKAEIKNYLKGLRKHGFLEEADFIVEKMVEMVEREGFREFYNPETGEGYRRDNFGWSSLVLDLL